MVLVTQKHSLASLTEYRVRLLAGAWVQRSLLPAARIAQLPEGIAIGVLALESSFRPWPLRVLEYSLLAANVLAWLVTGCPMRNLTVGPMQLGLHHAFCAAGLPTQRCGPKVHIARSLDAARCVLSLFSPTYSTQIAVERLARLWEVGLAENVQCPARFVGITYSGSTDYGVALARIAG